MKLSSINDYFNNNLSAIELHDKLKSILFEYRNKMNIRGISIPIEVNEDSNLDLGFKQIQRLCLSYIDGYGTSPPLLLA